MPRIKIDHKIVINYDFTSRDKYWGALSTHLIKTHGKGHYKEQQKVEEVLLDGFQFYFVPLNFFSINLFSNNFSHLR